MRALIVSRTFPPTGSVGGSIRLAKFMKYLSTQGWEFTVLTQDPNYPVVPEKDHSDILQSELPPHLQVIHNPAPIRMSDTLPDKHILNNFASVTWSLGVIERGLRICRKERFDLIYTNMPHFINGLISAIISRFLRIPLALDMKDDIVGSALYLSKSSIRQRVERIVEKLIFQTASKITFATSHSMEIYQSRYPKKCSDFFFLPNGCDLHEFLLDCSPISEVPKEKFLILNAATRYRKEYRDASSFLHTIASFLRQNPEAHEHIEVVFLANSLGDEYWELVEKLGLNGIIHNAIAASRNLYRAWLKRADLLFLVQPYGNTTSTAGTLYEYWATGKAPILLFAEKGASRDLVESHKIGRCFDFQDVASAVEYLTQVYLAAQAKYPILISRSGIEAFDRKKIALKMNEVWMACINNSKK